LDIILKSLRTNIETVKPLEVVKCKRCVNVISEPKELIISVKKKCLQTKSKTRHWFIFILLVVGIVFSIIGLALSRGEQYHVVPEEFRLVFYLSVLGTIVFGISLIVGIMYLRR